MMPTWREKTKAELDDTFVAILAYRGKAVPSTVHAWLVEWDIPSKPELRGDWAVIAFWDSYRNWTGGPAVHLQELNPEYLCVLGYPRSLLAGDKETPWGERATLSYAYNDLGVHYNWTDE